MKKILSLISGLVIASAFISTQAHAEYANPGQATGIGYTASGTSSTVTIAAVPGKRIAIWSILASSDKSTAKVTIAKAAATGVTTNYSTVAKINIGSATVVGQINTHGTALFVGSPYYGYQVSIDSTTANCVLVNYDYE